MKVPIPRSTLNIGIMSVSVIVIFLTLFYAGDVLGLEADVETDFLMIMPGLFFFAVGVLIIGRVGGLFALPGFTVVGIGVAVLSEEMYDLGILNDAMISGLTIGEFQIFAIAIMFALGAIVTGVTTRR